MLEHPHHRLALLFLLGAWLCVAATYPAFPVDETRYLTVAWEMHHGSWILPTLNGEPYSHKPPLLFWLINLVWLAFDPSAWSARLVCVISALIVLALTRKLAQALFPDRPAIYNLAPLLTLASPLFLIFSNTIFFDQLLHAVILGGLLALWKAGQEKRLIYWVLFGAAIGLGLMTKGPVVLVDLLPPALFAPFLWLANDGPYSKKNWYGHVLLGFVIGVAIILCWAIPAAIEGGPDYARMIFWGQSAGRMVDSFAHRAPFWFYIPYALFYMLPWLCIGALWRRFKDMPAFTQPLQIRFLLGWLVPSFLIFSAISGKQMHYILPLVSGAAILVAAWLERPEIAGERAPRPWFFLLYAAAFVFMAVAPFLPFIRDNRKYQDLSQGVGSFEHWPFALALMAGATFTWSMRKTMTGHALAMVFCACLFYGVTTIEGRLHAYRFYDLTTLRNTLQPYDEARRPIAFVGRYEGEITFLNRLIHPLVVIDKKQAAEWLAANPDGIAVLHNHTADPIPNAIVVYTQPYHGNERFSLLTAKVAKPARLMK